MLSCTHCRKITEGKNPPFVVLRIGYDSILVFYLFSYLFVQDLPVQGNPVQVNAVVVKQKSPESGAVGPKTICNCLYNRLLIVSFLADKYNCKSEQRCHQKHDVQRGIGGVARLRHCRYGGRL